MKENQFFGSIKNEVERKKEISKVKPLTLAEHESEPESGSEDKEPMSLKDHWLTLRQTIQGALPKEELTTEEQERTKILSELVTPELLDQYKQILKSFSSRIEISETHLEREFIDVDQEETSQMIEDWIESLTSELRSQKGIDFDETELAELQANCWLLFDSMASVLNTRSLERDISKFYKEKPVEEGDKKEAEERKIELTNELLKRYPMDKAELEILIDLVKPNEENYSLQILVDTIGRLWKEHKLGEQKGAMAKISLGYLLSKGAESFAPSLFQNMIAQGDISSYGIDFKQGDMNFPVFFEYFGLIKLADLIEAKTEIELAKLMNDINYQINERITNSLFFQEFEFIHEKSLGEVFTTLEKGKVATEQLLRETISKFTPILTGILMSLGFLAKINPALGLLGVGSLPIMYKIAKKQNEKIWPMYKEEKKEGEKIATRLGSIKSGFEEVKTSSEIPVIAGHMKQQMNDKDKLSLKRQIEEVKIKLIRMIPFDVSTAVAVGVGGALQQAGQISGGAVLSNVIYSNQLTQPVQELVHLYFDKFSRYIQDIQRMEEILGEYGKLDMPEGEKENDRLPVSSLENFDISIKDVQFKNILRKVNLEIKQGEFLTIVGESGEGKSTLFRNMVGLYKPDGGSIEIGGVSNDKLKKYGEESIYSVMSYCNQAPQIFDGMTLRENIMLWSKKEKSDEEIKQVLSDLHLNKFTNRLDEEVKHFSGGERTRIGLARMLIKDASIMLLDEPTTGLDSGNATKVSRENNCLHFAG